MQMLFILIKGKYTKKKSVFRIENWKLLAGFEIVEKNIYIFIRRYFSSFQKI